MNEARVTLVQKLTLGVLLLILVCLVMILARQGRERPHIDVENRSVPHVAEAEPELKSLGAVQTSVVSAVKKPAPQNVPTSFKPTLLEVSSPPTELVPARMPASSALVNPAPGSSRRDDSPGGGGEARSEASILGRVTLKGEPPSERTIIMDATCGQLHPEPALTRHYVVGRDGGLANVLVYVKSREVRANSIQAALRRSETPTVLDNVRCMFEPYVVGVLVGQPLKLVNSDPVLHNAHFVPKTNRERNLALPTKGHSTTVRFDAPELFMRVKCDVHPWMFAYVSAIEHSFFSVTDTNGMFALPAGLSSGTYQIAALHHRAGEVTEEIEIDGSARTVEFVMRVPAH